MPSVNFRKAAILITLTLVSISIGTTQGSPRPISHVFWKVGLFSLLFSRSSDRFSHKFTSHIAPDLINLDGHR